MLQKKFKIQSPMVPKGDQPKAIEQLVDGVNKGLHHQVLLGATGTGKSLTAQMPVLVFQKRGTRYLPLLKPIGEIVDHFLKEAARVSVVNDTELADASLCPEELYVLSFNPKKGGSELKKILQYQRHAAPAHLFRVKTTCGREVEVTGDHNFFVLRNGRIQLLKTEELCSDDHIPLPLETETSAELIPSLESVSLAPYLQSKSVYARVRDFTIQMEQDLGRAVTQKNLALALGKPAWAKYHHIVSRDARVSLDVFMKWKEFSQTETVHLGTKLSAVELPLQLPLEDALLQFLGLYIAEGFSSDRYVGASVREEEMKAICNRFAETYGWSHSYRPSGDFILFESLLVFLLDSWC